MDGGSSDVSTFSIVQLKKTTLVTKHYLVFLQGVKRGGFYSLA